jgi:hypothetical protein
MKDGIVMHNVDMEVYTATYRYEILNNYGEMMKSYIHTYIHTA